MFLGFNLTFFPQYILGYLGMPRRYHAYPPEFQVLNVLSSAGASILAVGLPDATVSILPGLFCVARRRRQIRGVPLALNGRRRHRHLPRISSPRRS